MDDARLFCEDLVSKALADHRSMVAHPLVDAVRAGEATVPQLVGFGTGMYRMVHDAQRWTAAGYAGCEDQEVRARMLSSMLEEEAGAQSGTASHSELLADFLEALGQPREQTYERSRRLGPRFQAWADLAEFLGRCRPYWLYRGTTSLAGEAQFTELCKLMVDALPEHYGVTGAGLTFWSVHIPIDAEHTSAAVELVAPFMDDAENRRLLELYTFQHMDLRYRAWMEPLETA